MDPSQAGALRSLLENQQLAALATLHKGDPAASMVPYALLPQGQGFVVHVSRLATHTADMQAHQAVGLLITASPGSASSPQELARASVQGRATLLVPDSPEHLAAKSAYLLRFPHTADLFSFSDFSLFAIRVRSLRFVGGFAQAATILAEEFSSIMSAGAASPP
jgi:putative heme iron utilization protein